MGQVFSQNGEVVPVTRVKAGPCQVSQIKKNNDQSAVQISFGEVKEWRVKKPQAGHLKDLDLARWVREFDLDQTDDISRGDTITVDTFSPGDKVTVIGVSKGKGFAGVVKRHHFRGGPASHGHKDNLRMPGSIGAGGVQRVFKGMRMGGRMGGDRVSVKNLEIIEVHPETNELYIKGAVPGGRNGLLMISAPGKLKVNKKALTESVSSATENTTTASESAVNS